MLEIKNLSVTVTEKKENILKNISLNFEKGKIYTIMGPNGSGKSTLVRSIMGDPIFSFSDSSSITLNNKSIENYSADKRAKLGIFLSMQAPIEIPGVTVFQLLRKALGSDDKKINIIEFKKQVDAIAQELEIPTELLNRSLNEGFSGGERKKMEILQMAILDPSYVFLDEIDTGVDVDALKIISNFLKKFIKDTDKTLIIITHYNRILKYLTPDEVIVIKKGKLITRGDSSLSAKICKTGFKDIN